jgi:hypothetical protein
LMMCSEHETRGSSTQSRTGSGICWWPFSHAAGSVPRKCSWPGWGG